MRTERNELDALLREIPSGMLELYQNLSFFDSLNELRSAPRPTAVWVIRKTRALLVKCRTVINTAEGYRTELEEALKRWDAEGDPDRQRLIQAEQTLLMLENAAGDFRAQEAALRQTLAAAKAAKDQAELCAALGAIQSLNRKEAVQ